MANWTELYRRRGHWLAIVKIEADGRHTPVNGSASFPTKETWKRFGPLVPGHIYAALQDFRDFGGDMNNYTVDALADLTEKGWSTGDAKDRSHLLYQQASTSRLLALDDPFFLTELAALGMISQEVLRRNLEPKPVSAPTCKPTTLRF